MLRHETPIDEKKISHREWERRRHGKGLRDPVVQGRRTQSISAIVPPLDRKVLPLFLDKVIMLYARDVHDKPF